MLERGLTVRGVDTEVVTAGFGNEGRPATRETQAVASARGLDLGDHRSHHLRAELARADLVLAMERVHVRDVVVADPPMWARSFTLKEAVRRAETVGPRDADEPFTTWLARLHEGRRSQDLLGSSPDDEVADPVGGPLVEHEETAAELDDLVTRFVDLAWPVAHAVRWSAPA